ncbi:hypothetical protein [Halomontanus rarus]|uniref:hypothetical protein n=1 Tax=Halomontanus rarus TaxID=3034020 RepID=UPI0023E7E140|nr:hypothetical protein [Halovivax sp. TS33]
MNRRSILAGAGVVLTGILAGCSFDDGAPSQCHLTHEVVESSADYGEVVETYRYEDLSDRARRAVEETLANGSYATANRSLKPGEFRYWDTVTVYNVTSQNGNGNGDGNETHTILTYAGEGCERD